MMQHTTAQALGQARLAEMHHQAQRATLARAARQARRARRQQSGHRPPGVLAAAAAWARRSRPTPESALWHPAGHPGPAGRTEQRALARQAATAARRASLFASELQPSDAPTAAMAAEAITAAVGRIGIIGCVGQMAEELGDHPDAASERMRWICQPATELPASPR